MDIDMDTAIRGEIYLITNTVNNKKYVGQTVNYRRYGNKYKKFGIQGRFKEHTEKKNQTLYLSQAIAKYGKEKFNIERITTCDIKDSNEYESFFIEYLNTLYPLGYNGNTGGGSKIPCREVKNKISGSLKEYYVDDEIRKKHSNLHINKFKKLIAADVDSIIIKRIRNEGSDKIIYAYIKLKNNKIVRRRYGGIHLGFLESVERAKKDSLELLNNDASKLIVCLNDNQQKKLDYEDKMNKIKGKITKIEIKIHKLKNNNATSVYITTDQIIKWDEKIRFVFGGKNISFNESYLAALDFVNNIKTPLCIIIDNT